MLGKLNENKFYVLVIILLVSMSSCEASKDYQKEDDAIRHQVHLLEGKTILIGKESIDKNALPRNLKDRIGYVELRYADLSGINIYKVIPEDSILILDLTCSNFCDKKAEILEDCRFLKDLIVRATNITDKSLVNLISLGHLKTINFDFCNITDDGLKSIAKIKSLRAVSFHSTHISDEGITWFKTNRPDVTVSRRRSTQVPSEKVRLAILKLLRKKIQVADGLAGMRKYHYRYYIKFSALGEGKPLPILSAEEVIPLINLISSYGRCRLEFYPKSDGGKNIFNEINLLKNVDSLSLYEGFNEQDKTDNERWFDNDLKVLDKFSCRSINLTGTSSITSNGFRNITNVKGLENLDLFRCIISTKSLQAISKCKSLKKISFDTIDFENVSLESLSQASSLEDIRFRHCKNIRSENIQKLKQLKTNLKVVNK